MPVSAAIDTNWNAAATADKPLCVVNVMQEPLEFGIANRVTGFWYDETGGNSSSIGTIDTAVNHQETGI